MNKLCFGLLVVSVLIINCGQPPASNDHRQHNAAASNTTSSSSPVADHTEHQRDTMVHSHMESSPGAGAAPLALQFLDTMIEHHKGAVEMSLLAETRSQHAELKELAANIINEQEREIAKMSEWRDQWFEGKPPAVNMEFPDMKHGMGGMNMEKLRSLSGNDFDVEFLRQMIPHHEGALEMSKAIKNGDSRLELKELADDITRSQQAEIKQMKEWLSAWSK